MFSPPTPVKFEPVYSDADNGAETGMILDGTDDSRN